MAANEDWTIPLIEHSKDSICFVVISPRATMIDKMHSLASEVEIVEKDHLLERCKETRVSTGFIVASRGNYLLILTTAHSIDHMYRDSMPISGRTAEGLFQASILCDHYEFDYRAAGLATLTDDRREYVPAKIIKVNSRRDLLLIAVEQSKLCAGIHPPVEICRSSAITGEESLLLSWPFGKQRRVATGCVGERRNVREVSRPNINEYNMEILEANITSESGSSGAPLFNKSGDVIGVLHGGFGQSHSYFIPSELVLDFLAQYLTTSDLRMTVQVDKRKGKEKEIVGKGKRSKNQH